jgi:hypothetical protein
MDEPISLCELMDSLPPPEMAQAVPTILNPLPALTKLRTETELPRAFASYTDLLPSLMNDRTLNVLLTRTKSTTDVFCTDPNDASAVADKLPLTFAKLRILTDEPYIPLSNTDKEPDTLCSDLMLKLLPTSPW